MFKNYKSLLLYFFCLLLITFTFVISFTKSYADDLEFCEDDPGLSSNNICVSSSDIIPEINSRSAIVIDRNSDTILYGKNQYVKVKMASTTKIMTSTIIIENCNLDDYVIVSKKAANTGGSRLGLKVSDKVKVIDLLYGLMLCSGNDAAVALAEYCSGSVNDFANLMNKKAQELNLLNTHFETPHGLDSDNHYTTAYELATLSNYALKNTTFNKLVGTKQTTIYINNNPKQITNTNELLDNLNGVYGIKTGFTNGANRCLVTSCKRNDLDIICVVLGADTKKFRTTDSIKLIEYCYANFSVTNISDLINNSFNEWKSKYLPSFILYKSSNNVSDLNIKLRNSSQILIPIKNSSKDSLVTSITCQDYIKAPRASNTKLGEIAIQLNNNIIAKNDIILDTPIFKKTIYDYFLEIFKIYSNYNFEKYQFQ